MIVEQQVGWIFEVTVCPTVELDFMALCYEEVLLLLMTEIRAHDNVQFTWPV